jgi:hypothetical protein
MSKLLLLTSLAAAAFACSSDYLIWIPRSQSADPLYRFTKGGKAGYIDTTGRVVIAPKFEAYGNSGGEFHDGLVEIAVSDGVYADRTGKIVVNNGLYRGWDFSEGLAVAMRKDENAWGYIDTTGKFVIPPQFATSPNGYVHPFSDGFAMVEVRGRYGYIDKSGKFAITPQFLDGTSFADGMARVVMEGPCSYNPEGGCGFANPVFPGAKEQAPYDPLGMARGKYPACKFTFTDRAGRVLPQRFDYARDFSEGFAPVKIRHSWGFIDKTGAIAIPPIFEDAEAFHGGLAKVTVKGLFGYADKSGTIIISTRFKYADSFSDGLASVGDGRDRYWYIDQHGRRAFDGDYQLASTFFKGLAHVRLRPSDPASEMASFAYIDTTGKLVFTY